MDNKLLMNERYIMSCVEKRSLNQLDYKRWFDFCMDDGINLGLFKRKYTDKPKDENPSNKAEKLLKKYNAEFAKQKEAIAKDYQTRLQAVDKSITETISATAKAKGYDIVISKGVVVYDGDDITADIQKVVK